ncbi:uncharacterized protein LOC131927119 [Physella acuta]|uniref:uncharacterized protein LOC131927119 n=1 Tax=Physella acuta TaxID=109671 RepID=UPI0027DBE28D|nr:uncharacterized protein LOC131927119 [Physella acuta]
MDKIKRDVLITNRVGLVDSINVNDGLYTQLLAKRVLSQRQVNRIKGNGRPEEEQVEELLNELSKKECFELFCEALIADNQEHIVKKYLQLPAAKETVASEASVAPPPACTNAGNPVCQPAQVQSLGATEASSPLKRTCPSSSSSTVLLIKENDNNLYIRYADETPEKHPRLTEQAVAFQPDETRYMMKHFVAEDTEQDGELDNRIMVPNVASRSILMSNPQSLDNPNIQDKSRYATAFGKEGDFIRLSSFGTSSKFIKLSPSLPSFDLTVLAAQKALHSVPRKPFTAPETESSRFQGDAVDTMALKTATWITNQNQNYMPDNSINDTIKKWDSLATNMQSSKSYRHVEILPDIGIGDMEEIDLPDGCVNVKVEHTSKEFFLNNFKKAYPLRQIPRGYALIINVDEVVGKPPRKGTNFDRDNLCNLLTQLHFNIIVFNDSDGLSAQDIVNKLKAFARMKEHEDLDACFICLLSHGEEGYIFGTDGKRIPLEEIFMLFGNTNCKGLIGKPKIFIIQACRGGFLDKGVQMDEPDGGGVPVRSGCQLPSMSDMLICYPTQTGYYAWRNRARGSWYIEAIVQVFMRYAKNEDICAMLNRVNHVVSRKVSECNLKEMNSMSQMSEYKSTLRQPHLFLFPGIGMSSQGM